MDRRLFLSGLLAAASSKAYAQNVTTDLLIPSPNTGRTTTSTYASAETIGQKLRRLATKAAASNPMSNPVAAGVTMTTTTTQDTTLTRTWTAVGQPTSFAVHGGTPTLVGGAYWVFPVSDTSPDVHGNCASVLSNQGLDAWGWEVDFMTDAPRLQIWVNGYQGANSNFRVVVDDHYVTFTPQTWAANGISYVTLDFAGVRQPRRIKFRSMVNNLFIGLYTLYADTVWAPDQSSTIKACFTGDSYTNHMGYLPTGGIYPDGNWTHVVGNYLGWEDIRQVAVGSTGYTNPGAYTLSGTNYTRVPIIQQIPRWQGLNPDVVVFAGGYNDPVSGLQANALAAWQYARSVMPNAPFFILGPWPGSGGQTSGPGLTTMQKEAAILAGFQQFNDPNSFFIPQNNINVPWISGTGYQGNVNGSGNSDYMIWTDGIHPSDLGYVQLGRRAAAGIRQAIYGIKN